MKYLAHLLEPLFALEVRITTLCTDLPLRRTGPQRFEATMRDYVPKEDLRILYIAE